MSLDIIGPQQKILVLSEWKCHAYKLKKLGRYNNISHNNERLSILDKNFPTEIIPFNTVLKLNPFAPGDFAEKFVLKPLEVKVNYHKAVYRLYTSQPSDPDAKYQLAQFSHARKAKKKVKKSWLYFSLSLLPSFFSFPVSFFFLLFGI